MYHRRKLVWTPRRAAAVIFIALLFAFVASWTSLPGARGRLQSRRSQLPHRDTCWPCAPESSLARIRLGLERASELRATLADQGASPIPSLIAQRQAAVANDAILPELPSIATLALTDTPTSRRPVLPAWHFQTRNAAPAANRPSMGVAAGPSNVVEVTNIVGRIFDKSGNDLSDFNLKQNNFLRGCYRYLFERPENRVRHAVAAMVHFLSDVRHHGPHNFSQRVLESCGFD